MRIVRGIGFLAGVGAGLIAALVTLALRALFGILSPPELLIAPVTAVMPPALFELALNALEFAAKPLLVATLLVAQVLLAGLVGAGYERLRSADQDHQNWLQGAFLVTVVTSVGSWLIFLPLVGEGLFGADGSTGAANHVLATLLTNGTYAYVLVQNLRRFRENARWPSGEASVASRERRRLLGQIGIGAGLVLVSGGIYRWVTQSGLARMTAASEGNGPRAIDAEGTSEVTPNDVFYTVSKNFGDPRVDASRWRLEVVGLVDRPLTFTYEELKALPAVEQYYTLCCISNEVGGDLIGNALWKGIPLKTLLDMAGVQPGVRKVIFHGADDYQDSVTCEIANRESNLLAWEMNGEPLPDGHGFPARLLIPNIYGMKNVKWLTKIELVDYDFKGFWQQRGWSDEAIINTMSRIDVPGRRTPLAEGTVSVSGIAFAGDRGISQVEISTDGGKTWQPATVKEALSPYSWVLWTAEWNAARGNHTLIVRATDGTGEVQTSEEASPLPDGATGHHSVVVRVDGLA